MSVFLHSTKRFLTSDDFKMIITSTSTLKTKEFIITRQDSTLRYDRFVIDDTVEDFPISNYDFVITQDTFNGEYDTVMDIIVNHPNSVIEIGKFRVRSNEETKIVEYITEKVEINEYEPENI